MKRSGGRRYYRPDDIDLLRGIRRLLYGEGYTIRGVQRILKEHGIKSVQGVADASAAVSFGSVEKAIGNSLLEEDEGVIVGIDSDDDDDAGIDGIDGIDFRFLESDKDGLSPAFASGPIPGVGGGRLLDAERLKGVLQDLIDCRQLV